MERTYKYFFSLLLFILPLWSQGYSVLTHEAIVDAAWNSSIVPLLKQKYPAATEEDITTAHAYAYGGAVAPDMGYYPFGSTFFTDLVHYVRSGDMATALLRDAETLNQYAFALGFLSHYIADHYGHPLGTNRSETIVYPKLHKKYGNYITYAEDETAHVRMEFGFDVLEVAKGNYASPAYRSFIGFKVDTTVLAKAFQETYGLNINEVFHGHFNRAVETFRWIVANIFPVITKSAWASKKKYIMLHDSTASSKRFRYKMNRKNYDKDFGTGYRRPGFFPTTLSFFIKILPKVGPLKALKFKAPTPQAEKYFDQSFDTVMHYYTGDIKQLGSHAITLNDIDFDTGMPTSLCEYPLADDTYCKLVCRLNDDAFKEVTPALQQNINGFYKEGKTVRNKKAFTAWSNFKALKASRISQ
jgi:hypothetical protein